MHLHFDIAGTGTPIVLTTGMGHTIEVWSVLARSLQQRARVLRWDHRGHGRSTHSNDPDDYSASLAVADLLSMLREAGGSAENPAILIGHSLGGYLSLCAAIAAPALVKGLVLIATGPGFRDDAAREKWNEYVMTMNAGDHVHPAALQLGLQTDGKLIEQLKSLTMPTLVIVGSEDHRFLGAKDYFVAKLAKASAVVIDGGKHSVHKTHPDQVDAAIQRFLDTHFPDS